MSSSLSCAIIGCGRMGTSHAKAVVSAGHNINYLVDQNASSFTRLLSAFTENNLNPSTFFSLDQLLLDAVPDLLVIATTADSHAYHAIRALNSGVKLILLEKPAATSLAACSEITGLALKLGGRIAVNHQMRFLPQYTIPKELLASKAYGGFKSMHVTAGNFGMAMNATHYFEAFRFLANASPTSVSAWFDRDALPNPRGPQFQDVSGCIRVTTSSGHRLYIDASSDQGHGLQVTYMARNGRITIDELTGEMTTVVRKSEHLDFPTSRYGMPVDVNHQQIPPVELVNSTRQVLEALIVGDNYPTLSDATLAVKVLVGAYHSHRNNGKLIFLDSISDGDSEVFAWA